MEAYTGEDGLLHNHTVHYPTLAEVETANRLQLGRWFRFLPSPGQGAIGMNLEQFNIALKQEKVILERILARFDEAGGWDSYLSKEIGWTL